MLPIPEPMAYSVFQEIIHYELSGEQTRELKNRQLILTY